MMSPFTTLYSMKLFQRLSAIKVESMQRSGTEAIRTQLQPSKQKREITNITNSQNTKRTYGQPSEQLFPKRWPLSNRSRTKNNMNTRKVKRHRNADTKTGNRESQQNYRRGTVSNELVCVCVWGGGGLKLVLRRQPHPQFSWDKHLVDCSVRMITLYLVNESSR